MIAMAARCAGSSQYPSALPVTGTVIGVTHGPLVRAGCHNFNVVSGKEQSIPRIDFGAGVGPDQFTLSDVTASERRYWS